MRLRLTPRTVLAVRALRTLQGAGRLTAAALAEALQTTRNYVPQVMAPLVRAGWVASGTGRAGGYELRAPLESLWLLDVVEAVEGPMDDARCLLADADCAADDGTCPLHWPWLSARQALLALLARSSVAGTHALDPETTAPTDRRSCQLQGDTR